MAKGRTYDRCGAAIDDGKRSDARYCSRACMKRAGEQRRQPVKNERKRQARAADPERVRARQRDAYWRYHEQALACASRSRQKYREKRNAANRAWARANPEKRIASELRRKYGISSKTYDALLRAQGGGCAICGARPNRKRLAVDHDHTTGKLRGLLCEGCNQALGLMADDPMRLQAAAAYLGDRS